MKRFSYIKIVLIPFITLAFLGGVVLYAQNLSKNETYVNDSLKAVASLSQSRSADGDGDGLLDWEEVLWGTDPKNPDSDGDGTNDGEEIKTNRDPLKKGPDDLLDKKIIDTNTAAAEEIKNNYTVKFTDAIIRALGPQVIQNNLGGLSERELSNLVLGAISDPEIIIGEIPRIKKSELTISDDSSPTAVKKYLNSVSEVYRRNIFTLRQNELNIVADAFETENLNLLSELDPILAAYERSQKEIMEISVPEGYEDFAATEIYFMSRAIRIAEVFRRADEDPLAALSLLPARFDLADEIKTFHRNAAGDFKQSGITFAPSDAAYLVFN